MWDNLLMLGRWEKTPADVRWLDASFWSNKKTVSARPHTGTHTLPVFLLAATQKGAFRLDLPSMMDEWPLK